MNEPSVGPDCILPLGVRLNAGVTVGARTVFSGADIEVGSGAVIEPACVIGDKVTIGQGAMLRAGAVVLKSVPPNAIVEGNPAQVVGYVDRKGYGTDIPTRLIDTTIFGNTPAPARLPLGVGGGALHLMRRVTDARGALTVGEVASELPFRPERYFIVFDVPSSELRGEHAHKECHQFLICVHGSCRVLVDDGVNRCEVTLDRPDLGVHMPPMLWGTQYRYSPDATLVVFASHGYDGNDYIREYSEFIAMSK